MAAADTVLAVVVVAAVVEVLAAVADTVAAEASAVVEVTQDAAPAVLA